MDIGLVLLICAIFVLILFSGFFSGSETALTACSRARMHSLARDGNRRAALVNTIREHKERMIGAILLGNNLVNILASALATALFIRYVGPEGVVYATIVMTLTVLIFAEVLPKTYALHAADKLAMVIAPAMRWIIFVFSPVTEMVSWVVRNVLKVFGVDISVVNVGDHLEILRGVIDLHQGPEKGATDQRAMLRSILDLAEVEVCEIMVHRKNVTMIDADSPIERIVAQVLDCPYTRLPVFRGEPDNIIGVIHAKWLLREMKDRGNIEDIRIENVAAEPWFIPESTSLNDQLQAFRRRREHFAIVVDEYGAFMGIVTLEDILEEIVGEIDDEHDIAVAGVRKMPGGSFLIDGTVTIRDLNREFEWSLPDDEDYSTVAGLVLYKSQHIPEVGQSYTFEGFRFDIVRRQRNQITLLRVTPPVEETGGANVAGGR